MKSESLKRFYANAKLLISGEYLVLSGAEALAVPLKKGQWLEVEISEGGVSPILTWKACVLDNKWFSATLLLPNLEILESTDQLVANRLAKIFRELTGMNRELFDPGKSYSFSTVSDFDHRWGMGSSSALIANLARWAMVGPFDLLRRLNRGSGYDIAAALAAGPILFSTSRMGDKIIPVKFMPSFNNHIWFVYRGIKRDTEQSIQDYEALPQPTLQQIGLMNYFTGELLNAKKVKHYMQIMHEHESFISNILGIKTVKEEYFSDFNGEIKSLGAWGGDMMMAVSESPGDYVSTYFREKDIKTVFDFHSLILT